MKLPPGLGPLLTADDFEPFVGKAFSVEAAPEPVEVTLDSIERRRKQEGMLREPFTLLLSTPWDVLLTEGLYHMQAEGGGPFDLHIIPIAAVSEDRRLYQIVFN